MAVGFKVDIFFYEVGHPDFLHSFFSTISYHTEPEGWGTKYPLLMKNLYFDKLSWEDTEEALQNVEEIRGILSKLPPSKVIWDIEDVEKQPPWGNKIPTRITSLENYHATPTGKTFLDLLSNALKVAKRNEIDVTVSNLGK
ncbi:immunity 70 family protein [Bacillus albus]|uniref:immunity 70 family protein n=1 Tax=Bacillus TaxID=1386 RepID=UPI00200061E0|nr:MULTISPECIES: immunity 70 family protein [Bacillus]MDA2025011.1 immunity 70 family protein [Bacillus cereus group sp. Bcc03]MDA2214756.1 immunity 70 family protein [Bacillus cereus group sp. Bc228]MDA2226712.1 immunity 70 family protein [Bacillus cereus group sp. Bc227]MDA2259083.1 immunity 70 family protein [Bacillus cereus group sp. Bc200]MDA2325067.1 immunity 70 family protein [Bacillus cereus group sp. Bc177]